MKRSLHDRIIITINYIIGILALFSACAVDSDTWIPTIVLIVCLAWLSLFIYANWRN